MTLTASWTSDQMHLVAGWDNRPESAAQIAARLFATLQAIEAAFGVGMGWEEVPSRASVEATSAESLESFVLGTVATDDFGDEHPASGFEFALSGKSGGRHAFAQFFVGSSVSGRRKVSNAAMVSLTPVTPGEVDTVLLAVAEFWQPASAVAWNTDVAMLSGGRGRFTPPVGQRTWLRDDLGPVTTAPDGVRIEHVAGGTLLSADDTWTPEHVNQAMVGALTMNGITTIPRGPRT